MNQHSRQILHTLLDKYENSGSYRGTSTRPRRLFYRFTPRSLPAYFDDTSARQKEEINSDMIHLAEAGVIEIFWVKHEEGNLIQKVALRIEGLPTAFHLLRRTPRQSREESMLALVRNYRGQGPAWLENFLAWLEERLLLREGISPYLDLHDVDTADRVLTALQALTELQEETPERVFSLRVLGHSKAWAAIAQRVLRIVRDFHGGWGLEEAREVWAEFGLVANPQHIFVYGNLTLQVAGGIVETRLFQPDLGLSAQLIQNMQVLDVQADFLITIENLTSFYQFIRKHPGQYVAVYLGGYHNRLRREFLQKIQRCLLEQGREIPCYHWGDIDYGGFDIFRHLAEHSLLPLNPYLMDSETLLRHRHLALAISDAYARRLAGLLDKPGFEVFREVIEVMLRERIRLEQESVEVIV
ncbi:Wadjet anti-phage system protein JetD domain-containing protein [Carboxydocella sp. JDF658]|uniref:Wadjet anti-phage system protein JetD domain-containing protein n=1 Tax=Carboxydocella sp. JDF658 TaxID=1926600 RepID=UPI0009AC8210|nr:Wadjet anti-phage system protein JetD domain-containing protein [Carboxydocella sp. JDF658]GAW32312.1 hypothetical protein JDF658_20770 [Carboxydocella sp. JDF658]